MAHVLAQVTPEDVLNFGLIPELVGRLPILTPLMPLTVEAMVQILTEPKNALDSPVSAPLPTRRSRS